MIAKRGTASTRTYSVGGQTLAEISADIDQKGPRDLNDGRRYSGSCKGELIVTIGARDFAFETTEGSSPVEVTATLKAGTITSNSVITMPQLTSQAGLSAAALQEWRRFLTKVQVHEDGHVDSYYELARTLADEFNAASATGTGRDEHAAQAAAQRALNAQLSRDYGGSVLDNRVKADARAYDAQNNHGATQGAALDTSIT